MAKTITVMGKRYSLKDGTKDKKEVKSLKEKYKAQGKSVRVRKETLTKGARPWYRIYTR